MPTNGMTIDGLNTVSSLTAQDKVPVWDNESSGEPTRKITAQDFTNSVKTLGSLVNTTDMNTAIEQSTADVIRTGDVVNNLTSTATDKPLAAAQGKALNNKITTVNSGNVGSNFVWYKFGRVAYVKILDGTFTVSEGGTIGTLPAVCKPISSADFIDAYSKKRIQIDMNGNIVSVEALNNTILRGTVLYITAT